MDKNETLKTLQDFNDSDVKEALDMSIKFLQAPESTQIAHNSKSMPCQHKFNYWAFCTKCKRNFLDIMCSKR